MTDAKRFTCRLIGLILSVLPVLICVITYFPIWNERGSRAIISGFALLLIILSVLPFLRVIREYLKSPSAYVIWLFVFLFFLAVSEIADEMTVIAFVGFVGNLLGSVFFALAKAPDGDKGEK